MTLSTIINQRGFSSLLKIALPLHLFPPALTAAGKARQRQKSATLCMMTKPGVRRPIVMRQ